MLPPLQIYLFHWLLQDLPADHCNSMTELRYLCSSSFLLGKRITEMIACVKYFFNYWHFFFWFKAFHDRDKHSRKFASECGYPVGWIVFSRYDLAFFPSFEAMFIISIKRQHPHQKTGLPTSNINSDIPADEAPESYKSHPLVHEYLHQQTFQAHRHHDL